MSYTTNGVSVYVPKTTSNCSSSSTHCRFEDVTQCMYCLQIITRQFCVAADDSYVSKHVSKQCQHSSPTATAPELQNQRTGLSNGQQPQKRVASQVPHMQLDQTNKNNRSAFGSATIYPLRLHTINLIANSPALASPQRSNNISDGASDR